MALGVSYSQSTGNETNNRIFDVENTDKMSFVEDSTETAAAKTAIDAFVEAELDNPNTLKAIMEHQAQGNSFDSYFEQNVAQPLSPLTRLFKKLEEANVIQSDEVKQETREDLQQLQIQLTAGGQDMMAKKLKEEGDRRLRDGDTVNDASGQNMLQQARLYNDSQVGSGLDNGQAAQIDQLKNTKQTELINNIQQYKNLSGKDKTDMREKIADMFVGENAAREKRIGGSGIKGDVSENNLPITIVENNTTRTVNLDQFLQLMENNATILKVDGEMTSTALAGSINNNPAHNGILRFTRVHLTTPNNVINNPNGSNQNTVNTNNTIPNINPRTGQTAENESGGQDASDNHSSGIDHGLPRNTTIGFVPQDIFDLADESTNIDGRRRALRRIKKGHDDLDFDEQISDNDKKDLKTFAKAIKKLTKHEKGGNFGVVIANIREQYNILGKEKVTRTSEREDALSLSKRESKHYAKLAELYVDYREEKSGSPYMRALRASLTNQDIGESAFGVNDFYNNNNNLGELGKRVDGYKVDGNAVRNIFKLYDDLGEDIGEERKGDVRRLVKRVENGDVDLSKITKVHRNEELGEYDKPSGLNKKEERVRDIYKHKGNDLYRDILYGLGEGKDLDEIYRQKLLINKLELKDNINSSNRSMSARVFRLLEDGSIDGQIKHDDVESQTGLNIYDVFKDTGVDVKNTFNYTTTAQAEQHMLRNTLQFVRGRVAKPNQDRDLGGKLHDVLGREPLPSGLTEDKYKEADMYAKHNIFTPEAAHELFKQEPGLVEMIKHTLLNSGIPPEYILKYGGGIGTGFDTSTDKLNTVPGTSAGDMRAKDISNATMAGFSESQSIEFNREFDAHRGLLSTQAKDMGVEKFLAPGSKEHFRTQLAGAIVSSLGESDGVGVGIGSTTEIMKGLTFNLKAGVSADTSGNANAILGVSIGYNKDLGNNWTLSSSLGLAGFLPLTSPLDLANFGVGPTLAVGVGKTREVGRDATKDLEAKGIKSITLGPQVGIIGTIPYAGIAMNYNRDKMADIDGTYNNLKSDVRNNTLKILQTINTSSKEEAIKDIKKHILGQYKGDSESAIIQRNAEAFRKLLNHFGGNDMSVLKNKDMQQAIAQNIADVYSLERRNRTMQGIENKRYFAGASLGINVMFGGTFAIVPSAAVSFAKHKGMYHEDTESGKKQLQHAEVSGIGNRKLEMANETLEGQLNYVYETLVVATEDIKGIDGLPYVVEKPAVTVVNGEARALIPRSRYNDDILNVEIDKQLMESQSIFFADSSGRDIGRQTGSARGAFLAAPGNTDFRMLIKRRGKDKSIVLNIGDVKTEKGDTLLQAGREELIKDERLGTKKYEGGRDSIYGVTSENIVDSLNKFPAQYNHFPLSKNAQNISIQGQNVVFGNIQNAANIKPSPYFANGVITIPKNHTLTIVQDKDGKFNISSALSNDSKLHINYQIDTAGRTAEKELSFIDPSVATQIKNIELLVNDALKKNPSIFAQAMINNSRGGDICDGFRKNIDEGQYTDALDNIKALLSHTNITGLIDTSGTIGILESYRSNIPKLSQLLGVFDAALTPVSNQVRFDTGSNSFNPRYNVPGGTKKLIEKREHSPRGTGLRDVFLREPELSGRTDVRDYFNKIQNDANKKIANGNASSYETNSMDNSVGMIFGFNEHDEVTDVAEKFAPNPLIATGATATFENSKDETQVLKKYFVENLVSNNTPLVEKLKTQIEAELGTPVSDNQRKENLSKLLLSNGVIHIKTASGKTVPIELNRNLKFAFCARCYNPELVLADLKIKRHDSDSQSHSETPGSTMGAGNFYVNTQSTRSIAQFAETKKFNVGVAGKFGAKVPPKGNHGPGIEGPDPNDQPGIE